MYIAFKGSFDLLAGVSGAFRISTDEDGKECVATVPVNTDAAITPLTGRKALYFTYTGTDAADFVSFTIQ